MPHTATSTGFALTGLQQSPNRAVESVINAVKEPQEVVCCGWLLCGSGVLLEEVLLVGRLRLGLPYAEVGQKWNL